MTTGHDAGRKIAIRRSGSWIIPGRSAVLTPTVLPKVKTGMFWQVFGNLADAFPIQVFNTVWKRRRQTDRRLNPIADAGKYALSLKRLRVETEDRFSVVKKTLRSVM